jgi:chromosome partitioning protein
MVITIGQQKGGVGKTTTALNLAVLARRGGQQVLAVDIDPQFALTRQLGIQVKDLPVSIVDVLAGRVDASDAILTDVHGIDVLPATRELGAVELALVGEVGREGFLRDAVDSLDYDLIVIDTPPNLGLLTVNALVAADLVLAPVSAGDEGAAQGLAELRATIEKLKRLRPALPELQVIITKWQPRRIMSDVIAQAIAELGAEPIAHIPARALVERAAIERAPIALLAPDNSVSIAYQDLAEQLLAAPTR